MKGTPLWNLMTEWLQIEYSSEEIEAMLDKAHVERLDNRVICVYDNGITECLKVETKEYLIADTTIQ